MKKRGDHPRSEKRREPGRCPDPLRDDPLPQPRRRKPAELGPRQSQRFAKARELVTKHYQWMLRTDYLPRICAQGVVNDVFNNGRKVFEVGVPATDVPTMPIEFSIAAFGSATRWFARAYNWNKVFDDGTGTLDYLFTFSATGGDLGGKTRLLSTWIADFRRLYDFGEANSPTSRSRRTSSTGRCGSTRRSSIR